MKMKGKRGVVFTLDAFIATLLFTTVLFYLIFSFKERTISPHIEDIATDVVTILDYNDTFSETSPASIEAALNNTLPTGYRMQVNITKNSKVTLSTSAKLPLNRDISCNRRVVAITSGGNIIDFGMLKYCIWIEYEK